MANMLPLLYKLQADFLYHICYHQNSQRQFESMVLLKILWLQVVHQSLQNSCLYLRSKKKLYCCFNFFFLNGCLPRGRKVGILSLGIFLMSWKQTKILFLLARSNPSSMATRNQSWRLAWNQAATYISVDWNSVCSQGIWVWKLPMAEPQV